MFIKYNKDELSNLFSCEEMSLTDNWGDGKVLYVDKTRTDFELTLFINAYELECNVFLEYKNVDFFHAQFERVTEIKKERKWMVIYSDEQELLRIKFGESYDFEVTNKMV